MNRKVIIGVLVAIFIGITGFFIWAFTHDNNENEVKTEKHHKTKESTKPKSALTLEKDKKEQSELKLEEQRKAEAEKQKREAEKKKAEEDKKSKKAKDKQSKEDKASKDKEIKKVKSDLTESGKFILVTMYQSSDEQSKSSTQAKLNYIATSNFIDKFMRNEDDKADEKIVDIKNVRLKFDDESKLLTNEAEGYMIYDEIIKPKNKDNEEIKPSVQVDKEFKIWFKQEDGKMKFDKLKV
ncbi:hypothetical protein BS756_00900 [Staphylococcus sp. MB371]|nr:hypothetical protein BS756_00900 [Staphylococcus sp. MB371]